MRKRIFGRRLKRDTNERKALFRSLMNSVVFYGKIRTSEAKAKAIKGEIEKIVTIGRKGESARSELLSKLANEKAVNKIISEISPLFANRPGGYTRIVRIGSRVKDGAKIVMLSWVENVSVTNFTEPKRKISGASKVSKVSKRNEKAEKSSKESRSKTKSRDKK